MNEKELRSIKWDLRWFSAMLLAILSMIGWDIVEDPTVKSGLLVLLGCFMAMAIIVAFLPLLTRER